MKQVVKWIAEGAGASPETLVKLENGVLHTFPLAGTRPRGKTAEEDIALEKELLADKKNGRHFRWCDRRFSYYQAD